MLDILMLSSKDFYSVIASSYNSYCKYSGIEKDTEETITLIKQYTPKTVLEFGVGTGRFAKAFLKRNPDITYVGVDSSLYMVEHIQENGGTYTATDIFSFLKKCTQNGTCFDVLIAPYTELHHIETAKQLKLIKLMQQVAKTILLNVLTKETEMSLFATQQKVAVTYIHNNTPFTTEIYPIHQKIRDVCEEKNLPSGERVNTIFEQRA